jgi:hypothetical protein
MALPLDDKAWSVDGVECASNVIQAAKVELHDALSLSPTPHCDQQSVNFTREEPPNPVFED